MTNTLSDQEYNTLSDKLDNALKKANYNEAKHYSNELKKYWPNRPKGWDGLIRVSQATLPQTQSIKTIISAVENNPTNNHYKLRLAEAYLGLGLVGKAEKLLNKVKLLIPDHPHTNIVSARVAQACDEWDKAKNIWKSLFLKEQENSQRLRNLIHSYQQLGDLENAYKYYLLLIELNIALPIDHYNCERLKAWRSGSAFTIDESQKICDLYPDNPDLMSIHAFKLGRGGQLDEVLKYLKQMKNRELSEISALDVSIANVQESMCRYEDATKQYLRLIKEQPSNINNVFCAARCMAKNGSQSQAMDLLDWLADGLEFPSLLRAKAEIFRLVGDKRSALKTSLAAVRLQNNTINVAQLCESLWSLGRINACRKILILLDSKCHKHIEAVKWIGQFALKFKDFSKAGVMLRVYLKARPEEWDLMNRYADAVWQRGASKEFYFSKLACATQNPLFILGTDIVRRTKLKEIQNDIESAKEGLINSSEKRLIPKSAQLIRQIVTNPYLVKSTTLLDNATSDLISEVTECEINPSLRKIDNIRKNKLPAFLAENGNPETSASLIYRIANVYERLECIDDALDMIESAIFISKSDYFILDYYHELFRKRQPNLRLKKKPYVAILLVTCLPNLGRAEKLASLFGQETGMVVITLRGDTELLHYKMSEKGFGFELIVPCSDDYISLPNKLSLAYRYLAINSNCSGVLKIDDDIVLKDAFMFKNLIETCHKDKSGYVGWINEYNNSVFHHGRHQAKGSSPQVAVHDPVRYCNGGQGYYLSKKNLKIICDACLTHFAIKNHNVVYEDVYFGEILSRYGVVPTSLHMPANGGYVQDVYEPLKLLDVKADDFYTN